MFKFLVGLHRPDEKRFELIFLQSEKSVVFVLEYGNIIQILRISLFVGEGWLEGQGGRTTISNE